LRVTRGVTRFVNSVSSAVQWVKVVRPSGELVVLRAGEQDRELALLKDSYSAVGVVAEARRRFMEDGQERARALENRTFLFPKLDLALVRVHSDVRRATPTAPFETLLSGPNTPYVRLPRQLPRLGRSVILSGAVRLGADTNGRRKLHVQNLTPHPLDGSGYLFFSHEGQKLRPRQEKATRTLLRHAPHHRRAKPCSTSPAPQEPSQHALDHGPERAVPSG
jgi:hypothetical protein